MTKLSHIKNTEMAITIMADALRAEIKKVVDENVELKSTVERLRVAIDSYENSRAQFTNTTRRYKA